MVNYLDRSSTRIQQQQKQQQQQPHQHRHRRRHHQQHHHHYYEIRVGGCNEEHVVQCKRNRLTGLVWVWMGDWKLKISRIEG